MQKAVIYARYSSERQSEQSIEGQVHECQAFAKARDIIIVKSYIDRALSGKTDDRPAFKQMIKDSSSGIFDCVIVYKTDRFARNRYDSAVYKSRLKKNGVKIFYAKENIPDGPEGIILESMLEGFAEYYSAELSQKVKRGIKENVRKGLAFGGTCPYGYKIVNKRYTINDVRRPYVVKIFNDYAAGKRLTDIIASLNAAPDYANKGSVWNKCSLHRMFANKKYIGIYNAQGLTIPDAIPPIVDEDVFIKVQQRQLLNKHHPGTGKAKVNYLLSGKIFCGLCGKVMNGSSGTSKTGRTYYYYRCKNKDCRQTMRKSRLEKMVVDATTQYILVPNNFAEIARRCMDIYKKEQQADDKIGNFEKQLVTIKTKIDNLMKAIEAGIITETTKARLTRLEDDKHNIVIKLKNQQINNNLPELSEEHIIYMLTHFYKHRADIDFYDKIIDGFIHKVYVYDKSICVIYNLIDTGKDISKADIDGLYMSSYINSFGGDEENRTPVRKHCSTSFSERILCLNFRQ